MDIRIIGIGTNCSKVIDRLVKDSREIRVAIVDTDDRLVNSPYRQIQLQKEFIRKLNQGFYVSVLDPISMADKWEKSRKSGDKAKLREQCTNLVREIISFIGDADMVFVISGMACEAGSRITRETAFAVKHCSNRKCIVLDRRVDIHRCMSPHLSTAGFMDMQIEFNDMNNGNRLIQEAQSDRDDVIFAIIAHCIAKAEEEGIDSFSSKSILEKIKWVNIDSDLRIHIQERTSYNLNATNLQKQNV